VLGDLIFVFSVKSIFECEKYEENEKIEQYPIFDGYAKDIRRGKI